MQFAVTFSDESLVILQTSKILSAYSIFSTTAGRTNVLLLSFLIPALNVPLSSADSIDEVHE